MTRLPDRRAPVLLGPASPPASRSPAAGARAAAPPASGNPYIGATLGEAAASAGRTQTFLGAKLRRLVRHMPKKKAQGAVMRTQLVIAHALLSDPEAEYRDLGPGYYEQRAGTRRQARGHVRSLERLGYKVTIEPVDPDTGETAHPPPASRQLHTRRSAPEADGTNPPPPAAAACPAKVLLSDQGRLRPLPRQDFGHYPPRSRRVDRTGRRPGAAARDIR